MVLILDNKGIEDEGTEDEENMQFSESDEGFVRKEFYQYNGRPSTGEIDHRAEYGNKQLGYRHTCVYCKSMNTEFIRNIYWICYNCSNSFTTYEAMEHLNCVKHNIPDVDLNKGYIPYANQNKSKVRKLKTSTGSTSASFDSLRDRLKKNK